MEGGGLRALFTTFLAHDNTPPATWQDACTHRCKCNVYDNLETWRTIFKYCFFFAFFFLLFFIQQVIKSQAGLPQIVLKYQRYYYSAMTEAILRRWHSFPFRWGEKDQIGHLVFNISNCQGAVSIQQMLACLEIQCGWLYSLPYFQLLFQRTLVWFVWLYLLWVCLSLVVRSGFFWSSTCVLFPWLSGCFPAVSPSPCWFRPSSVCYLPRSLWPSALLRLEF